MDSPASQASLVDSPTVALQTRSTDFLHGDFAHDNTSSHQPQRRASVEQGAAKIAALAHQEALAAQESVRSAQARLAEPMSDVEPRGSRASSIEFERELARTTPTVRRRKKNKEPDMAEYLASLKAETAASRKNTMDLKAAREETSSAMKARR